MRGNATGDLAAGASTHAMVRRCSGVLRAPGRISERSVKHADTSEEQPVSQEIRTLLLEALVAPRSHLILFPASAEYIPGAALPLGVAP